MTCDSFWNDEMFLISYIVEKKNGKRNIRIWLLHDHFASCSMWMSFVCIHNRWLLLINDLILRKLAEITIKFKGDFDVFISWLRVDHCKKATNWTQKLNWMTHLLTTYFFEWRSNLWTDLCERYFRNALQR